MFGHTEDFRNQICDLQCRLNASEALVLSLLTKIDLLQSQLIQFLRPVESAEVPLIGMLPENVTNAISFVAAGNPSLEAHLGNWARGELALGSDSELVATRIRTGDEEEPARGIPIEELEFIPPNDLGPAERETEDDEPEGDE
jgi:hypothetical protein